jgi:outer membrane protein OmpA-like peptidoglycan-associated protein
VVELQDANTTLLKNLSSFAEVSSKNSDNISKAMTSLNEKEKQLKSINDAISSNDSTAVIVLTNVKQTLGEDAKIGVSGGAVVISNNLIALFGGDTSTSVTTEAQSWLQKVANILTANPKMALTIEGLSMTGNLQLAVQQAAAISEVFQKQFTIAPERITILGKDGNFKEGVNLKIHPKYDAFYRMVKESMKNGNQ